VPVAVSSDEDVVATFELDLLGRSVGSFVMTAKSDESVDKSTYSASCCTVGIEVGRGVTGAADSILAGGGLVMGD